MRAKGRGTLRVCDLLMGRLSESPVAASTLFSAAFVAGAASAAAADAAKAEADASAAALAEDAGVAAAAPPEAAETALHAEADRVEQQAGNADGGMTTENTPNTSPSATPANPNN